MRIWLVQTGEMLPLTPLDRRMRTGHLAMELASRGHQVIWWSSSFDHLSKRWIEKKDKTIRLNDNLKIKLIKGIGYNKNVSFKRYLDHLYLAFKFKKQIQKERVPDIIISSLPDHHLAYEATKYALKKDVPVVIDLRDLWPDLFIDLIKQTFFKKLIKILLARDYWKTRFSLQHAHGLVTMMLHYLQIGSERGQRLNNKNDRIFYLGAENIKVQEKKNIREEVNFIISTVREKFVVLFVGAFNKISHPITLINAVKSIKEMDTSLEIEFILAGDGEHFEKLKSLASGYPQIKFTGWINNDEVSALLKIADVGIVTVNEPIIAFPNKVFTYLSGGLPIISSLEGEVKEIINKENIGYFYEYDKPQDLMKKILLLAESKKLRDSMASNSKKVFDRLFDSKNIYSSYADYVENIVSARVAISPHKNMN